MLDVSGAAMPGVTVKVYQGDQVVKESTSGATGDFAIPLPAGEYRVEVSAPDFTTHEEIVRVAPGLGPLTVTLQLGMIVQEVQVEAQKQEISIDSSNILTATVLGEDFIETLPEDEEQLRAILEQIAASGGAAGGQAQFIIDGFSGGRLPPRDQIMQIRINSNPYTTEFSQGGFNRMEIITRAGGGQWRGNLGFNFRDEALNAAAFPLLKRPPYQQRSFNTGINGPLIPGKLSFSMNANHSNSENSDTILAFKPAGTISEAIVRPNYRRNINTRGTYQLSRNHQLNFNVSFGSNRSLNQGPGNFTLSERASDSESRDFEFQLRETSVIGSRIVHEARFAINRDTGSTTPRTVGVAINVLDAFSEGGAQNRNNDRNKNWEFGNALSYASRRLQLKTGFQGNYRDQYSFSENNFQGTFTFSSLADYLAGRPITYTVTRGNPLLEVSQFEAGAFLQTDWTLHPRFSLSVGVRYDAQTNLSDYNNFDPRVGFAFKVNNNTILRGGGGLYHQRFNIGQTETLLRADGDRQQQYVVRTPSYPDPFLSGTVTMIPPSSIRIKAEDLAAPYTTTSSMSIERTFKSGLRLTGTYAFDRGMHLLRSRNINAPLDITSAVPRSCRPGQPASQCVRPDPSRGNILLVESTGLSRAHSFTVGFNHNLPNGLGFFGNYTTSSSYSDVSGGGFGGFGGGGGGAGQPMDNYNLRLDWGRSNEYVKHRVFTGVNYRMPWGIFVNSHINASSGRPYNITTGRDDNFDTSTNDRPDGVPRNSATGPGSWNVNLNFSKTIELKKQETSGPTPGNGAAGQASHYINNFAEPQRGGGGGFPGGGQRGGDRGGQGGPGRGPGMGRGGPGGPGGFEGRGGPGFGQQQRRLQMQINMNIQNLFNHRNFQSPSGVLTSPFFGRSTRAQNPREVSMGVRFNF
ncbi:MAG: TonB-dependent receptor [Acidobacteria bacterium]|nr:TonB-dependent receptor [Acidobacteriota bacterium]